MLYAPQVEQLGVQLSPHGNALAGSCDNEKARADVWVRPLGKAGVITSHRMLVKRDLPFFEQSAESLCIGELSADSLALCPIAQPPKAKAWGNAAVFGQQNRMTNCWLRANTWQNATSIMLLPQWFYGLETKQRRVGLALIEEPGEAFEEEDASAFAALARSISPLFGGGVSDKELHARVAQAALAAIEWHEERSRSERAAGCFEQARLVREAKRYIELNLGKALSLDGIARDLLTSRTRLCAAFKQETGVGIGSYIRRRRMERARDLLEIRQLPIREVALMVGYPRISSFDVAFERAFGTPPRAWRERFACGRTCRDASKAANRPRSQQ